MQPIKPDLQRLGIFKELSYHTIGDPYVPFQGSPMRDRTNPRGIPPMYLPGGYSKLRAANSDGYFAPFASVHVGDGALTHADLERQLHKEEKSKRIGKGEWIPNGGGKLRSGTGSSFGNFQEHYTAMDPASKMIPKQPQLKNFYTNPGKKGTGFGYIDVCLNPFPKWQEGDSAYYNMHAYYAKQKAEHLAKLKGRGPFISMCRTLDAFDGNPWAKGDPLAPGGPSSVKFGIAAFPKSLQIGPTFIPSSPAKLDGGMKDGTLSKFPTYSSDPYTGPVRISREDRTKFLSGPWIPNPDTALVIPTPSIVNKNVVLRVNGKTRKKRQKVWDAC